ncbi:hypothetical protein [Microbacterium lushaniae]|nr:hypothetical protein [Microbacterium lushaniae]
MPETASIVTLGASGDVRSATPSALVMLTEIARTMGAMVTSVIIKIMYAR